MGQLIASVVIVAGVLCVIAAATESPFFLSIACLLLILGLVGSMIGGRRQAATELVFIGKPGVVSTDRIDEHFERAFEEANNPGEDGYRVADLRAFNVVFA